MRRSTRDVDLTPAPTPGKSKRAKVRNDPAAGRQAEDAALRERDFSRAALESLPGLFYVFNAQGRFLRWNTALERVSGYSGNELTRMSPLDLFGQPDRGIVSEAIGKVFRTGEATVEGDLTSKDGTRTPHTFTGKLIQFDGQPCVVGMGIDLTERRLADEARWATEERYHSLFDNMLDGYAHCRILLDHDTPHDFIYLDVNKAFERLTGLRNVAGRKVSDVIPGIRESNPELFDIYGRVARTGKPERFETFVKGLESWFSVSAYCPAPEHFVAIFTDTTARRHAETTLRLFRTLVDRSNDAIEVVDPGTGRFLDVNEKGCLDLGYTREEFLALSVADIDPTVDETSFTRIAAELRVSGALMWEGIHRRKNGSTFPVEVNIRYVQLDRDYLVTVVRDITDRRRAEAELRLQSAALNAAANAIVITDHRGTIEWVNAAFSDSTGYSAEEAIGRNPRDLVKSGVHDEAFYRHLWGTILAGGVWRGEMMNRRKDGTVYAEDLTITPVRDARGEIAHFVAIKRDLTEEKRLEAQFRQAQKMEAIGRLAGGVAHDFNNLLTVIVAECDYALSELEGDSPVRDSLEEVRRAGVRATALTRQLLSFSRKEPADPSVFSPDDLLADVDKMLKRLIGAHIQVVSRSGAEGGRVRADRGQIEQVLINLAVNAADAMPNGGTLAIETASVDLDEDYARSHADVTPGPYLMLAVSDTGTGIADDVKAHLFEPFYTTKERGKGTGLGLATCHGIVKQWGGHIGVYSEVGIGTTMKAYLPRADEAAVDPAAEAGPAPLHGSATILLVEDEPAVRQVAGRILRGQGYTVLEAGEGEQALRLLEQHQEQVHLLLTDVVLPGLRGRELAERVSSLRPGIRLLYISGYTDDVTTRNGLLQPGAALLQKPFTAESVGRRVREALDTPRSGA